jgi:hypothetical protein
MAVARGTAEISAQAATPGAGKYREGKAARGIDAPYREIGGQRDAGNGKGETPGENTNAGREDAGERRQPFLDHLDDADGKEIEDQGSGHRYGDVLDVFELIFHGKLLGAGLAEKPFVSNRITGLPPSMHRRCQTSKSPPVRDGSQLFTELPG